MLWSCLSFFVNRISFNFQNLIVILPHIAGLHKHSKLLKRHVKHHCVTKWAKSLCSFLIDYGILGLTLLIIIMTFCILCNFAVVASCLTFYPSNVIQRRMMILPNKYPNAAKCAFQIVKVLDMLSL